jgi:hypothetical protein
VSRSLKLTIGILVAMVVAGLITLPNLRKAIQGLRGTSRTAEQERREVIQVPISTPTDVNVKAQMYWLSPAASASLEATTIEIPLSADPVERSKQLLNALIIKAPAPERRTLPLDVTLLALYIRPDGTAIVDFSDALSTETPSGILSEQRVVDSLTQTLGANVPAIRQLKILVHGQQVETLAGHLDLSGIFRVLTTGTANGQAPQAPAVSPSTSTTGANPTGPALVSPAPANHPAN